MTTSRSITAAATVALAACVHVSTPSQGPSGGGSVAVARPVTPSVPAALACASDADCEVSCERSDQCCPQLCTCTNVYNRQALAQLQAQHRATCEGGCPIAQCAETQEHTVAHCVQGRCEGQVVRAAP
jgi:hypothetical protein